MADGMRRTMWLVILPWKSFPMIGEAITLEEANAYVQGIWPSAYCEAP